MCQALASTLDEEEISDLRDQFDAIDVDKNGVISLEEMRQVSCFSGNMLDCICCLFIWYLIVCIVQAMEKDLPWRMKDSRVLEILQAVYCLLFPPRAV